MRWVLGGAGLRAPCEAGAMNGSVAVPVRCRPHTALHSHATTHHNQRHTHAYVIMGLRPVGVGKHEPSAQYSPATCDSEAGTAGQRGHFESS